MAVIWKKGSNGYYSLGEFSIDSYEAETHQVRPYTLKRKGDLVGRFTSTKQAKEYARKLLRSEANAQVARPKKAKFLQSIKSLNKKYGKD